jgi:hypothetical protein
MEEDMFWTRRASPKRNGQTQRASRVPIGLKLAYTGYVAVLLSPFGIGLAAAERQQSGSTQTDPIQAAPYTQEYEGHVTVRADHTATEVVTQRFKILTQGAVASLGQQKLVFVSGMQILDTVSAYTEKPDGRRILVEPKGILTQDAPPGQQATYFRDLKQRTVIFPDVSVGDTLVMTHKREMAPRTIFKQLTEERQFPRSGAFTSIKITVEAPLSIGLRVKALGNGVAETVAQTGGTQRHTIAITPQSYAPEEIGTVSSLDRDPAVVMSTYKSYGELGSAYGQTALPKAAVTPNIAALANDITKGITNRKAQAVAIDAWMKKNIRYVAVILSFGRVIPNDASTVLKNRFGDCKDKTTLMAALLAAKGIASEPALMNLGNAYTLPEPPTLAALNHVILYLPEFDLYDDPTANWAAFGVLALEGYDKPVVRVSAGGAKIAHTPAMMPDDHQASARTTINIAADGTVTGRTEESATGALGIGLRAAAAAVQTLGDQAAARRLLQKYFAPGTGHFDLGNFADTTDPVVIKSSFSLDERFKPPPLGTRAAITHGMLLVAWPGTFLLGERLSARQSPFVCYAGRETEDIEASFDPALPMPLPLAPVSIDNPSFAYRSTMTVEGRTLKSHREFVSKVERQVCSPELEAAIAADLTTVRVNVFSAFAFGSSPPSVTANVAAPAVGTGPNYVNANLGSRSPQAQNPPAAQSPTVAQNMPAAPIPPRSPQTIELSRIVAGELRGRLDFLYSVEPDCSSIGQTTVRILAQPQHGTLAVENGHGFTGFPKENPRYECNTRRSDGTLVFYEPNSGYTGADSITLFVIYPSGSAQTRHYSIEVK